MPPRSARAAENRASFAEKLSSHALTRLAKRLDLCEQDTGLRTALRRLRSLRVQQCTNGERVASALPLLRAVTTR